MIGALNPAEVYGVTPGIGMRLMPDANGIATVGPSLEDATTGDTDFTGSLTFSNEVRFTGLTLNVSVQLCLVMLFEASTALTGAVTIGLTGINDPTTATGDMLIKSGGTFAAYSAFNGQTFIQNMPFRFAASGGMLLGGNTGGSAGVHVLKTDHLVLCRLQPMAEPLVLLLHLFIF